MSDISVQVFVAEFQEEQVAKEAFKKFQEAYDVENAAVIHKDTSGKLHIKESADTSGGKGAGAGLLVGGALGLLGGPVGILAVGAIGGVIGGLASHFKDSGLRNERLEQMGAQLEPGSSALVAVVEYQWADQVRKELEAAGAKVVDTVLPSEIVVQIQENSSLGNVSYVPDAPHREELDRSSMAGV